MAILITREIEYHLNGIYFPLINKFFSLPSVGFLCLIFRVISHFAEGLSICDPLKIKHLIKHPQ